MNEERFPQLVQQLYGIVTELEAMFPGRHFTPDGHMVGSLGECLAAHYYGLQLVPASTKGCDGHHCGRRVEVKATQRACVALNGEPEHLLVLKLNPAGGFEEVYNGPGRHVWGLVAHKPLPKNGQHQVRITVLKRMMDSVPIADRIPRMR